MNKKQSDLNKAWLSAKGEPVVGTLTCDTEKYRELIQEFDLSEQEQTELLEILFSIMASFVDLGFGVDSLQFLQTDADKQASDLKDPSTAMPRGSQALKDIDHEE